MKTDESLSPESTEMLSSWERSFSVDHVLSWLWKTLLVNLFVIFLK